MNRIGLVCLLPLVALATPRDGPGKVDVSLVIPEGPCLGFRVEADGKPIADRFEQGIRRLFDFLDRDGDGFLSPHEARRAPSGFDLRRLTWGIIHAPAGIGEGWKACDTNRDGKLTRAEFAASYRHGELGVQVGIGRSLMSERLTVALMRHLDGNEDGKVTVAELKAAERVLATRDSNEDERIAPGELIRGGAYPGAQGSQRLEPGKEAFGLRRDRGSRQINRNWIVRWKEHEPGLFRLIEGREVELFQDEWVSQGLRVLVRVDRGRFDGLMGAARNRLVRQFVAARGERTGGLTAKTPAVEKDRGLQLLLSHADRNEDEKLTRTELDAWLSLQEDLGRSQILVTVLDHGKGLFEFLDADGDGFLSVREMRLAHGRLEKAGCLPGGVLDTKSIPRTLRITLSGGHPRQAIVGLRRNGPAWFQAMDRNGDGDVSRKEFVGDPAVFDRLDTDRDGLLRLEEAVKARR